MKNYYLIFSTILLIAGISCSNNLFKQYDSIKINKQTWEGYKYCFIKNGRVIRPKHNDTVSEGQAYAMLRAVWLNDKKTFNDCYIWTENNLSRIKKTNDNLLAWHWKNGRVTDWMPASDADIDYALSLFLAYAKWGNSNLSDLDDYKTKALKIVSDILRLETFSVNNQLILSPWIIDLDKLQDNFPVNPSYFSPAHFRIFYSFTKDEKWLKLIESSYDILNKLKNNFADNKGIGLIPDWCMINKKGKIIPYEGKSNDFGWEALRIMFRVSLDYEWFKNVNAKKFLMTSFVPFIESEWNKNKSIYCEYDYSGKSLNPYENAAFYSCYYLALNTSESKISKLILDKNRSFLKKYNKYFIYHNEKEYYVNSLAWLAEGIISGIIKKF